MSLWDEIQEKCSPEQIAARNMHDIAATLNVDRTKVVSTMITERGILAKYPDGAVAADTILTKLEAFSTAGHPMSSIVARALKFLANTGGIDVGDTATRGLLDALAAGNVITVEEASKLKGLAVVPDHVDWTQVQAAFDAQGA